MLGIPSHVLKTAAIALATFAVVAVVQRHVMPLPVVGGYLPK